MKNLIIFFVISIIIQSNLIAQNQPLNNDNTLETNTSSQNKTKKLIENKFDYKKSTAVNVLYAIPVGEFSKKTDNGGFAKPGWGVSFDSRNHIGYGFSFVSYSSYSWIDIDSKAMANRITTDIGLPTSIEGGQHRPFFSTLGLSKHFYLAPRVQMGISATAGLLYTSFKSFEITIRDNTNSIIYEDIIRIDPDFAFAYGFSTDLNLFIIKNVLALHIEGKYNTAKTDSYLRSNSFQTMKFHEKMEFFNVNMGFIFFGK